MLRRAVVVVILTIVVLTTVGCKTADGPKEDVTFIGDKTAAILD